MRLKCLTDQQLKTMESRLFNARAEALYRFSLEHPRYLLLHRVKERIRREIYARFYR